MGSGRPQEGGNQTQNTQEPERFLEGEQLQVGVGVGAVQFMDLRWERGWSPAFKVSTSRCSLFSDRCLTQGCVLQSASSTRAPSSWLRCDTGSGWPWSLGSGYPFQQLGPEREHASPLSIPTPGTAPL